MKFLLVGAVHHPEEALKAKQANALLDRPSLDDFTFPPSQPLFYWTRALRQLGHSTQSYVRNTPALFGLPERRFKKFTGTRTLTTLFNAASYRLPYLQPDFRMRNQRLIDAVHKFEPDALLFVGDNREIYPETLATIKQRFGCKIVYMSGVSPIVFSSALERKAAPLYDLVIVNDYYHGIQWLELGAQQMEALPMSGCDPDYHHAYALSPQEQQAYQCDVGFVGTLLPDSLYSSRVKALEGLTDFDFGVWSVHGIPESLKAHYRGTALGEKMLHVLCGSKIQINPHGNFMRYGGNMRLFEAASCGVFQIADDLPGVSKWFTPDENIVVYRDIADLKAKTRYYLDHSGEREQIAAAAQAHVYAHHTYKHRMTALADLVAAL